jgi:hypothetical protein
VQIWRSGDYPRNFSSHVFSKSRYPTIISLSADRRLAKFSKESKQRAAEFIIAVLVDQSAQLRCNFSEGSLANGILDRFLRHTLL